MSGIYPKAQAPVTEVTAEYASQRAHRWQIRYDEAMDMALMWQQRYMELKKKMDDLLDRQEEIHRNQDELERLIKEKSQVDPGSPAHPNTMIGRSPHGERDHHPAD